MIINGIIQQDHGLIDYKFFCFNGKPYCVYVDIDRYTGHKRNFYDINWQNLNITSDYPGFDDKIIKKPEELKEMLDIVKKLSTDFPFVRVDLYNLKGKIYFGELTFYPLSGYVLFTPDSFDFTLGEQFILPTK